MILFSFQSENDENFKFRFFRTHNASNTYEKKSKIIFFRVPDKWRRKVITSNGDQLKPQRPFVVWCSNKHNHIINTTAGVNLTSLRHRNTKKVIINRYIKRLSKQFTIINVSVFQTNRVKGKKKTFMNDDLCAWISHILNLLLEHLRKYLFQVSNFKFREVKMAKNCTWNDKIQLVNGKRYEEIFNIFRRSNSNYYSFFTLFLIVTSKLWKE